jgi:hypothetical protein
MFAELDRKSDIANYLCPERKRPPVSTKGAWTDYAINPWLNDPANGSENATDRRATLRDISDGTSLTILVGQAGIDPSLRPRARPRPTAR